MTNRSFDHRLTMVEIQSILIDSGLSDEASKLIDLSKKLADGNAISDKDFEANQPSIKGIPNIHGLQKTLLDSTPGFLELDSIRKATLLYLTNRIGYAGVSQNHKLWDCLSKKDFDGAANVINRIDILKPDQKEIISELIRNANEQRN